MQPKGHTPMMSPGAPCQARGGMPAVRQQTIQPATLYSRQGSAMQGRRAVETIARMKQGGI
jgi:hypothetical protein